MDPDDLGFLKMSAFVTAVKDHLRKKRQDLADGRGFPQP
jgi:hypothetical protein